MEGMNTATMDKNLKVLLGCEESQEVCKAFRALGHEAYSNDIIECSGGHPEWHLQMDVCEAIEYADWDLAVFFTPCTYSCNSGIRWMYNKDGSIDKARWILMKEYADMLRLALNSKIPHVGCENPIPHKYALGVIGRRYDQIIQPWQFGHGETKATCLWLKGLPLLNPTEVVEGREQRIWKMPPGADRAKLRSKTYPGIARAMAQQWSEYVLNLKSNY